MREGVCLSWMDWGREKILESSSSLGLETIYIAPFHGRTDLTTKVWVQKLCIAWEELGTQDHPTRGSASTQCVLHLNLIKGKFNILFYTHTHTHTHTSIYLSIQHCILILNPNIYLSHISCHILEYIYHT